MNNKRKEQIVAEYLATSSGRNKLSAAMIAPIKARVNYGSMASAFLTQTIIHVEK